MEDKSSLLAMLGDEFNYWEKLLTGLREDQIMASDLITSLSIKDTVAHLTAWQERSVARMEAALHALEPQYPMWPSGLDPEAEDVDSINAWIFERYREQAWEEVHREWRERYLHFLELGEAVPERDLMEEGRYTWLAGYPLASILVGSYEHHEEHLVPILAFFNPTKGKTKP